MLDYVFNPHTIMTEEYVKRLLAFWQSAKQDCQRKIDRYEKGERNSLLSELYNSGTLHEGLRNCEEKITLCKQQLNELCTL
jgi:hypothetical protein